MAEAIKTNEVVAPVLTKNEKINQQLIKFFWISVWLEFISCVIQVVVLYITGQIDGALMFVLILNLTNIIIIGGGAKLVQSYIKAIYSEADDIKK